MRNFGCLLGCRDDWLLALAHAWHIHDLVEVLGLCDLNCILHPLDREICLCLQARPRSARELAVALVPSTAGFAALGLLHGRRVCCLSSRSQASARQSVRSLLAMSESAFARERAADLSVTSLAVRSELWLVFKLDGALRDSLP